jgi:hypothetical protein
MENKFQKFITKIASLLIVIYLGGAFFYWANGSLPFHTDNGRDFLLIDELAQEKFVLIGARTSFGGVFHGPLWLYINLPAFLIGQGNPMFQIGYWAIILITFIISTYFLLKKVFGQYPAIISTLLLSINMMTVTKIFTNPVGAFLLMPVFWYTMMTYLKDNKWVYLFLHYCIAGAIIHFEMMIGVPLAILSVGLQAYHWNKYRNSKHWLAIIGLLSFISSFVLFDLRNNFLQTKSFIEHAFRDAHETHSFGDIVTFITQRFDIITRDGLGVFTDRLASFNEFAFLVLVIYLVKFLKKKQVKKSVLISIYYYIGYYLFTLLFQDTLLFHYIWPAVFFPIMTFSYIYSKNQNKFTHIVVAFALMCGFVNVRDSVIYANRSIGNIEDDWRFLYNTTNEIYKNNEPDIGVFIYAPDVYAYEQKYAAKFQAKMQSGTTTTHFFRKRPITYLLIAPPSGLGTEVTSREWKRDKLKISREPDSVATMSAWYKIERYELSDEEMLIQPDSDIDNWIHFR